MKRRESISRQLATLNADAQRRARDAQALVRERARLEDLLTSIDKMPVEYVKKAENMKEVKRREKKRAQQQADQDRIQEERNRKSNERSMQPPKKRMMVGGEHDPGFQS